MANHRIPHSPLSTLLVHRCIWIMIDYRDFILLWVNLKNLMYLGQIYNLIVVLNFRNALGTFYEWTHWQSCKINHVSMQVLCSSSFSFIIMGYQKLKLFAKLLILKKKLCTMLNIKFIKQFQKRLFISRRQLVMTLWAVNIESLWP